MDIRRKSSFKYMLINAILLMNIIAILIFVVLIKPSMDIF